MAGTALMLLLAMFAAARLPGLPPARRAAIGFLFGIGAPVLASSIVARFGVQPNFPLILVVFVAIAGAFWTATRRPDASRDDPRWIGVVGIAFVVAILSALLGRPPAGGVLIDPWAHIAWSRDLPGVFALYPPGFPSFCAILGVDDPLIGAFRLSPLLLHSALAAQFLAIGETSGAPWPAAIAALAYLVVPVAFGKFEPPRPEILAAVCIAATWWVLFEDLPRRRWTYFSLAAITCVLLVTHVSIVEIAHLVALAICLMCGLTGGSAGTRRAQLTALLTGAAVSLAVSPWPLRLLMRSESILDIPSAHTTTSFPGAVEIARMWGPGLCAAGAAAVAWFLSRWRIVRSNSRGLLLGLAAFAALVLAPPLLIAAGVRVPIPLATYRFYLSAALPLAIGSAVVGALAWNERRTSRFGVIVCALIVAFDFCFRPWFSAAVGLVALVVVAAAWGVARRPHRARSLAVAATLALAFGVALRLLIWTPDRPAEATWLAEKGDRRATVVTNWPVVVVLDALAPQSVVDGLAGRDANVARHRSEETPPLREKLDWCGGDEACGRAVGELRAALTEMAALPAYVVVGDRFAESWSVYAEQRSHLAARGTLNDLPFWSTEPCTEAAAERVRRMQAALDAAPEVVREFSGGGVVIYRMDRLGEGPPPGGVK